MADLKHVSRAALLMLGMDIGYNIGSFSLSAPQTTERRIKDTEGAQETPREAMKWVWLSTWKMLAYTALPSLLGRTPWPMIGGLIVVADVHGSYRYAIACGKRSITPGGRVVDAHLQPGQRRPVQPSPRTRSVASSLGVEAIVQSAEALL